MRWEASSMVAALLLALAPRASAQQASQEEALPARIRLDYHRGPSAEQCPSELALRDALTARGVGHLFDREAPARLVVTAKRAGNEYAGTAELLDAHGAVLRKTKPILDGC